MSDAARQAVLQMKYARIIGVIAERAGVSLEEAMGIFYGSETMPLIQEGVADLHCRSDEYLAGEILREAPSQPLGRTRGGFSSGGATGSF